MRDVVTNNANCESRALDSANILHRISNPVKIVLTHSLEQQEAAIGFPSVGDPVRPFGGNRVAVTDVDSPMIARSTGFDGKLAGKTEIPVGHLAVIMPRDNIARGQRVEARADIAPRDNRLDVLHVVIRFVGCRGQVVFPCSASIFSTSR